MKIFFKLPNISEYTGGYRAYKLGVLKKAFEIFGGRFIELGSFGFVCTFEKLVKLNLLNTKFSEIKFAHEYHKKLSPSKMVPWITILGYILLLPLIYFPKTGWRWQVKRLVN
jgi:dolichol-phosphate mannosyltransferase